LANSLASSTGTSRFELRSVLLPTSMTTMFLSAWRCSSSSHFSILLKVWRLVMSYVSNAPVAPL
jgi:hypothetical protein